MSTVNLITSVPVTPPWDQGDKNFAYLLSQALPDLDFNLFTLRSSQPPSGNNIHPAALYHSPRPSVLEKARIFAWLMAQPVENTIDHFIYRPYRWSSWFFRHIPATQRRPSLHTVPATGDERSLAPELFFADQVVAISAYGRDLLEANGLPGVRWIPPGIDTKLWTRLNGKGQRTKNHLVLTDRPVVLFTGHYGPGQGAEVVARALPQLVQLVPEVCVLLACRLRSSRDRQVEGQLRAYLYSIGLQQNVRFYNTVANMAEMIAASDVAILPMLNMRDKLDIPTTLLEMMAAGKPVVISDLAPMNEILKHAPREGQEHTPAGYCVPPGDAEALAYRVSEILQDETLRSAMGRQAQSLVQDQYDILHTAQQYARLYQELAST